MKKKNDFEQEMYDNNPLSDETHFSVGGGTETTRYYASLLQKHDGGIVPNTFTEKQDLHLSLDQSVGGRFFFSSRRRHTRYWRDWSSDVCSSDLANDALKRHKLG